MMGTFDTTSIQAKLTRSEAWYPPAVGTEGREDSPGAADMD